MNAPSEIVAMAERTYWIGVFNPQNVKGPSDRFKIFFREIMRKA